MLLSKVFLAGLLVLCIGIGSSNGQDAVTEKQPPDFGRGFLGFVANKLKEMFFKNRKDNSDSIQTLTNNINDTMTLFSSDIRAIGGQINKFGGDIRVIINLGNSSGDLVQKALTVAVQGTSLIATLMETLNVFQKTFNDVYQGFHRIFDTILYAIDNNVQFAKNFVTYTPTEIGKKLKVILDRLMVIANVIKKILLAAMDEVRIVILQGAIRITNGGLPIQQFLQNVFDQLQVVLSKILEQITKLQTTLIDILTNIRTTTTSTIKSALTPIRQGFESILKQIGTTRDKVLQRFSPSSDNALPAPAAAATTTTTTTTEATTIEITASTAKNTTKLGSKK